MKIKIPLVIIAGGKSSRMGEDKTLLAFGGENTLIDYQVKKFEKYFEKIYISTKVLDKFGANFNYIIDYNQTYSPLIGIKSSFDFLKNHDKIFFLSADTPFIKIDTIKKILDSNSIVNIASTKYNHPLCGLYKKEFLPIVEDYIQKDFHKLNFILKQTDTNYIKFEDEDEFLNMNNKEDYAKALSLIYHS
jgi:molybdopterin-guanine dinucleotide biosynthesis protein A